MPDLTWPPPGLEPLHGRFASLARALALASGLVTVATVGFAGAVPQVFTITTNVAARICFSIGILGVVVMVVVAVIAAGDVARAARAVSRGYTWLTIAEVMADWRRDTGVLITGEREYRSLTPTMRSTCRVLRIASSLCFLTAAALRRRRSLRPHGLAMSSRTPAG